MSHTRQSTIVHPFLSSSHSRPLAVTVAIGILLGLVLCGNVLSGNAALGQFAETDPFGADDSAGFFGPGSQNAKTTIDAQFTAASETQPARLFITATIDPGWHIYSVTQAPGGPVKTQIKLTPSDKYWVVGQEMIVSPPPEEKIEEVFDNLLVESHYDKVTWSVPIEMKPGTDPATLRIEGTVTVQPCDANGCLPPSNVSFSATLGQGVSLAGGQAISPKPEIGNQKPNTVGPSMVSTPGAHNVPSPNEKEPIDDEAEGAAEFDPESVSVADEEEIAGMSVGKAIGLGLLGGLILNLMPCVLPVIGLKILSFVEQAGHSRGRALMLNICYSLGLLSVFLVLATLAAVAGYGWGELFTNVGFNIALAAVVFAMALSFLGVWEIPIPGFAGRGKVLEASEQEGVVGAFVKGALTTVLATPCSAPFLAPALTWALAEDEPEKIYAIFLSVGLGMASPYLLIGAFPGLISFLPKPGMWMETFKEIMGFVLLGTVVFILTFMPFPYVIPTLALLFGIWAGCWWIGRVSPTAGFATKAYAWIAAFVFAAFVWLLAFPGIQFRLPGKPAAWSFNLHKIMVGRFERDAGQWIAKNLDETQVALPEMAVEEGLPWRPFTRRGFEEHLAAGRTVLVDFTADWCLTCKTLEATVLDTLPVKEVVEKNGVVTLQADWTRKDPEVTEMLHLLGSKMVPVIAVFPAGRPNEPFVFRGGYTQQTLLDRLEKAGPSVIAP